MSETNKRAFPDNEVRVDDDKARLPKIVCYLDTGKKYEDGNSIKARINLYKSVVYEGSSDASPYGEATDRPCYRVDLGKFPKVGLTGDGVKHLIKGLQQLMKDFPL